MVIPAQAGIQKIAGQPSLAPQITEDWYGSRQIAGFPPARE